MPSTSDGRVTLRIASKVLEETGLHTVASFG
jgi:hypothetical protein